jgi:hypothetical protein
VILEGCLVQGSGPTVFVLENAKLSTQDRTARGMSYIVSEATAADLDLSDHLNHQVRLTGLTTPAPAASTPPAPSGASAQPGQAAPGGAASGGAAASSAAGQRTAAAERMMAKITAKNLTKVSDTCVQAGD